MEAGACGPSSLNVQCLAMVVYVHDHVFVTTRSQTLTACRVMLQSQLRACHVTQNLAPVRCSQCSILLLMTFGCLIQSMQEITL
jgi:hypothetical protein